MIMLNLKTSLLALASMGAIAAFVVQPPRALVSKGQWQQVSMKMTGLAVGTDDDVANVEVDTAPADAVEEVESPVAEVAEEVAEEETATPEEDSVEAAPAEASEPAEEEGTQVYIGNLSFDLDEDAVRQLFEEHGTVTEVKLPTDRNTGRPRGFGFITMPNAEEAAKAIEALNELEVAGRTVYVNPAGEPSSRPKPNRERTGDKGRVKIYVGNLSFFTEPADLESYFAQYGEVYDTYFPTERDTGRPRGFAFVTMKEEEAEVAIDNLDGREFDGRTLKVNKSLPRGAQPPRASGGGGRGGPRDEAQGTTLYVGNLSFDTPAETLKEVFEEYGEVVRCVLPTDRETGRPRGFGFVTMKPEDADRALDAHDMDLDGRFIQVNIAQPKGASPPPRESYDDSGYGGDDAY